VRFELLRNRGAAFGVGAAHPLLVTVVEVLVRALALCASAQAGGLAERVALSVVAGGATANLGDRLAHVAVTDWIHCCSGAVRLPAIDGPSSHDA